MPTLEAMVKRQIVRRDANELIAEVFRRDDGNLLVTCECSEIQCGRLVTLPPEEYESVRAEPTYFLVVPEHNKHPVDTVVKNQDGYVIVAVVEAVAHFARETDPRGPSNKTAPD